ncbi:hypothetical protein EV286_11818 [Rhizobium sp. BK251]|nr:hypothetical protein EV286_11818 [Rhizobium sp. BK251]
MVARRPKGLSRAIAAVAHKIRDSLMPGVIELNPKRDSGKDTDTPTDAGQLNPLDAAGMAQLILRSSFCPTHPSVLCSVPTPLG